MNDFSSEQKEKYLKQGGISCPNCNSGNLSGDSVDIASGQAWQSILCNNCQTGWTDVYTLTNIERA